MNRNLRVWIVALVVSTLLFARQIATFSLASNRYYFTWDHTDAAVLIGDVLGVAALGVGIYAIVRAINKPWLTRLAGHLWIIPLVIGALSNIDAMANLSNAWQIAWSIVLLAILAISLWKPSLRIVEFCQTLCVVFFLLPVILLAQVATWNTWRTPSETYRPAPAKPGATPVFIFSFDSMGWTYLRQGTEVKESLPNLRRLSRQAYRFPEARSAGTNTTESLPRMVYQIDSPLRIPGMGEPVQGMDSPSFIIDGKPVSSAIQPSIFALAHAMGYQSELVTFYLPWRALLQDQVDYVHVFNEEPHGRGILGRAYYTLLRNLRYYPYVRGHEAWEAIYPKIYSENWLKINREMQLEVARILDKSPHSTLGFFHFPLPHAPFIFNADGSYRGPYQDARMRGRSEDYMRNVQYADRVIGTLMKKLKQAGKFEDALIIITSDHGWLPNHRSPLTEEILKRNTLMIKLPGQSKPGMIAEPVQNTSLKGIVELAMQGRLNDATFRAEMARVALPAIPPAAATKPSSRPRRGPPATHP